MDLALIYKALGDGTRLKIFELLKGGKKCACTILEAFNFTQPTLSYHMKILAGSGLVNAEKSGRWMYYSINADALAILKNNLNTEGAKDDLYDC